MNKLQHREQIAELTEKYLAEGNEIEQVPRRQFLAPHCEWMRKYGWDYMPWQEYESDKVELLFTRIGEGSYLTPPVFLED